MDFTYIRQFLLPIYILLIVAADITDVEGNDDDTGEEEQEEK